MSIFYKMFFVYILVISLPVALTVLKVYITSKARQKAYEKNKKKSNDDVLDNYDPNNMINYNENIKPLYEEGRQLFNDLMKSGKLKKPQINYIKYLLDSSMGVYVKKYEKYKFKNDAHEIYVKMKSTKIEKSDWCRLIIYMKDYA